jgi:Lrp/AsnC family transcriptional regulator, leucine-responsive regulatory protein
MAIKLDIKDKRILYELDRNSRIANSEIAKKVGLSPEAVMYRIKRFDKEGIIVGYQPVINLSKLGIIMFKLCLSFQHLSEKELEKIILELKKKENIKWIVTVQGRWDLFISVDVNSLAEIDKVKKEILTYFGDKVREKVISIIIKTSIFSREYFLEEKKGILDRIVINSCNKVEIDDLSLKILKELSFNSRISLVDLSNKVGSTVRIVQYRIKELEKKRIIEGYTISIDYSKLGIKYYKCFIYLGNLDLKRVHEFENYLKNNKNIMHDVNVLSDWDYEPEFEVFSEEEFDDILSDIRNKFSDIINKIDTVTIRKEYKFVYF